MSEFEPKAIAVFQKRKQTIRRRNVQIKDLQHRLEAAEHSLKLADALAEAVRAQHQYVDLERLGVACEICKALAAFRAARGKGR